MPLTFADVAHVAPLKKKDCHAALGGGDPVHNSKVSCTCVCNLLQNFHWSASYRTPVNMGQVREIHNFSLPSMNPPEAFPMIAIFATDSPCMDVASHTGSQQLVSPIKPQLAMLSSMADAVEQGADGAVFARWRKLVLSAPVTFEVHREGDDRHWRTQNIRQ
eukprot:4364728-Pyramimonas_sp.AAC.1